MQVHLTETIDDLLFDRDEEFFAVTLPIVWNRNYHSQNMIRTKIGH